MKISIWINCIVLSRAVGIVLLVTVERVVVMAVVTTYGKPTSTCQEL